MDRFHARAAHLVLALLLVVIASAPVAAWTYLGFKWQNPGDLTYWNYSSGADSTAWTSAVTKWNVTPTPIIIRRASVRGNEDIGGYSVNRNDVMWDGVTIYFHTGATYTYAQSELNDFFVSAYAANKLQSVSVHEFGHALSLGHQAGAVVMNAATSGFQSRWCTFAVNTPQADDINGINAIY